MSERKEYYLKKNIYGELELVEKEKSNAETAIGALLLMLLVFCIIVFLLLSPIIIPLLGLKMDLHKRFWAGIGSIIGFIYFIIDCQQKWITANIFGGGVNSHTGLPYIGILNNDVFICVVTVNILGVLFGIKLIYDSFESRKTNTITEEIVSNDTVVNLENPDIIRLNTLFEKGAISESELLFLKNKIALNNQEKTVSQQETVPLQKKNASIDWIIFIIALSLIVTLSVILLIQNNKTKNSLNSVDINDTISSPIPADENLYNQKQPELLIIDSVSSNENIISNSENKDSITDIKANIPTDLKGIVISEKAYFYNSPNYDKILKSYIVKNDTLDILDFQNNFIKCKMSNIHGSTTGWIESKSLELLE